MSVNKKREYSKVIFFECNSFSSLLNLLCCRQMLLRIENILVAYRQLTMKVAQHATDQRDAAGLLPPFNTRRLRFTRAFFLCRHMWAVTVWQNSQCLFCGYVLSCSSGVTFACFIPEISCWQFFSSCNILLNFFCISCCNTLSVTWNNRATSGVSVEARCL